MTDSTATPSPEKRNGYAIPVTQRKDESQDSAVARAMMDPCIHNAFSSMLLLSGIAGKGLSLPDFPAYVDHFKAEAAKAEGGDIAIASRMLAAQAMHLDSMFAEFSRRAALNMGTYPDATALYARLALKAQANSRATLEALARLHQPRVQTVRHVHINDGGKAIIADKVNHYAGGVKNAETDEQCHATGVPIECASLQGQDAGWR